MDNSIRLLVEFGIPISISPVVTGANADAMQSFLEHLQALGINDVVLHRYHRTELCDDDRLNISYEQWTKICMLSNGIDGMNVSSYEESIERYHGGGNIDAPIDTGCVNGLTSICIMPNGKVVLCEHIPDVTSCCYGDLKKESVEDIWNGTHRHELIFPDVKYYKNTLCEDCQHFELCLKKMACRKLSFLECGDAMYPSSLTRKLCSTFRGESV
jgi:radical SAM protein with 4Fe4S-binding SPASM domain